MSEEAKQDAEKIRRVFGKPTQIATSSTMRMIRNGYPKESVSAWLKLYG